MTGDTVAGTSTVKKYYALAGSTYAMSNNGVMQYLLTDHLGSVVAVTDTLGTLLEDSRYMPFGTIRSDVGSVTQTDKSFTGQKSLANTGLMDYNARMYSPELGRFIQPDTIVPNYLASISFNRYAYGNNNSILYSDFSGHMPCDGVINCSGDEYSSEATNMNVHLFQEISGISSPALDAIELGLNKVEDHIIRFTSSLPIELGSGIHTYSIRLRTSRLKALGRFGGIYNGGALVLGIVFSVYDTIERAGNTHPQPYSLFIDLTVDLGGFILPEIAGDGIALSMSGTGGVGIGLGFLADQVIGIIYDSLIEKYNIRGNLKYLAYIYYAVQKENYREYKSTYQPMPIAPNVPQMYTTPVPQANYCLFLQPMVIPFSSPQISSTPSPR